MLFTLKSIGLTELSAAFPLLKILRPDLKPDEFIAAYNSANKTGILMLDGVVHEEVLVALISSRHWCDFNHDKYLCIDDLIVTEDYRRIGIASELLQYAEDKAVHFDCNGLVVSVAVSNLIGRRFYENEGWELKDYLFKKGF